MTENTVTLTAEDVKTIGRILNLDKLREGVAISKGEADDMAKERRRVIISWNDDGTPVYKQIQGDDQDEVNVKIVQAFIDSGRIWEFLKKPEVMP